MSKIVDEESKVLCSRRTLLRSSLGLGAGAVLVDLGLSGCAGRYKADGGTQRVPKSEVPVGGGVLIGWYVLTQPTAGTLKAFYAACPHAGLKVTGVDGDRIVCDRHHSEFAISDGSHLEGPAPSGLTPAPFTEDGDVLIVTMPKVN